MCVSGRRGRMTVETDLTAYYRRREQDQLQAAYQASSQAVRTLHLNMADRFRQLAQETQLNQAEQDRDCQSTDDPASPPI